MTTLNEDLRKIGRFIYESGMLQRTPRSGLWVLGTGNQSVAEHLLRTTYIGYALAYLTPAANLERVVLLCLFPDFAEGRTSDLNYIHQRYGRLAEATAMHDLAETVPFGHQIEAYYTEEQARETLEAKLTKDADQLEWIATLREEEVKGNIKATAWITIGLKRLKTDVGRHVGQILRDLNPDDWWFNTDDQWWVDRHPSKRDWQNSSKRTNKSSQKLPRT